MNHLPSVLIATLSSVILLGGCSQQHANSSLALSMDPSLSANAAGEQSGIYTYDYYPSSEVYFDHDRGLYFWHASAYWGIGRRVPSTYKLDASERRTISLDTDKPYRAHEQVLARFPLPTTGVIVVSVDPDRE